MASVLDLDDAALLDALVEEELALVNGNKCARTSREYQLSRVEAPTTPSASAARGRSELPTPAAPQRSREGQSSEPSVDEVRRRVCPRATARIWCLTDAPGWRERR